MPQLDKMPVARKFLIPAVLIFFMSMLVIGWNVSGPSSLTRVLGATGLVLVVILIMAKGYRRYLNGENPQQKIKVVSRHSLGSRQSVAIIEVDKRRLLIGCTDQQICLLTELNSEDLLPLTDTIKSNNNELSFSDLLRKRKKDEQPILSDI